jgi:hypothetical protein
MLLHRTESVLQFMATSKPYRSLRHWLRETGHSQGSLRALVYAKTGLYISKSAMCSYITGAHLASLPKALALSRVTGVPVEKLSDGSTMQSRRISEQAVENQVAK